MSCEIEWAGRMYDVDPEEFTTRELGLIKERTGLAYPNLVIGVLQGDGDAIRALFWLVEQRDNPSLKFGNYDGPPGRVWKQVMPFFAALSDEMGKASDRAAELVKAGSDPSPNGSDTPPTSSTD